MKFPAIYSNIIHLQIEMARSGLQASLLVRHPETNELYVNFDSQILTMIRETECMARLGLEIPPLAKTMRAKQTEYKDNYNALQVGHVMSHVINNWCLCQHAQILQIYRIYDKFKS